MLDGAGGTDIFLMPAGRVKLAAGSDVVRCIHFSKRVFRWYADCCRTPIANTAGPRFPVVGITNAFMDRAADGRSRDERLDAPLCRIFEQSATGPLPPSAPPPRSFGLSLFVSRHCSAGGGAGSAGRIRFSTKGQGHRSPSPMCSRRASALRLLRIEKNLIELICPSGKSVHECATTVRWKIIFG